RQREEAPPAGAVGKRRRLRVRHAGVGGVLQPASPARPARVRFARRVRAGLLQPPDGLRRPGHTHVTESPEKPVRFTLLLLPNHLVKRQKERDRESLYTPPGK